MLAATFARAVSFESFVERNECSSILFDLVMVAGMDVNLDLLRFIIILFIT